jgi:hypothetical protein
MGCIIACVVAAAEGNQMKNIYKLLVILVVLGVAFLLPGAALAQESNGDEVVVGGNYILEAGETFDGNLFVLGGNATIEDGAVLNGEIVVAGGNLTVSGAVNGDIFAAGGLIALTDTANIQGDISTVGGHVNRAAGAIVSGEINNNLRRPFELMFPGGDVVSPGPDVQMTGNPVYDAIWSAFWVMMRSFLWAALAVLVVLFAPASAERVAQAAVDKPLIMGSVGLLTILVVPAVLIVMAITICLLPVSLLGFLALSLGWAFGIVALGVETGKRLAALLKQEWALPVSAGIGAFILTLVTNGLNALLFCVGWLPALLIGSLGLGAVLLSRFGMRSYPPIDPLAERGSSTLLPVVPPAE